MTEAIVDIKQRGNNLWGRLPSVVTKQAHLHHHQKVHISVEGDKVVITPLKDQALTLEQRLAQFDLDRHGGEVMNSEQILGAERW
jgi:antitoxin MazE